MHLSMLSPREGTLGICGAFFSEETPPWCHNIWSNQIKYPHLGEVLSLNFIVVVVYILQIIGYKLPSFFIHSFDALCNPRKIINKSSIYSKVIKSNIVVAILQKQCGLYTMLSYTNLAFQVLQQDIIFSV